MTRVARKKRDESESAILSLDHVPSDIMLTFNCQNVIEILHEMSISSGTDVWMYN